MVFIYGGGFEFGSSNNPTYDGTNFAEEGVVLVRLNYRLGNFGFLALSQLDSEGSNSGNFGLQDQIFALHWVRKNIATFGGDPANILIFGESAGAHSVGLLMSSPLATGSFNKAIMESGAWWDSEHGSITTFDQARQIGSAWTTRVGATSLTDLRALSAQTIVTTL
jgi:para-nitrobenzyl esterase